MAQFFLQSGDFLWNSGIFVWSVSSIIKALEKHASDVADLFRDGQKYYYTGEETKEGLKLLVLHINSPSKALIALAR